MAALLAGRRRTARRACLQIELMSAVLTAGLFVIDHRLETGMDDLFRFGPAAAGKRYAAVDASSYAYANLHAVSEITEDMIGHAYGHVSSFK